MGIQSFDRDAAFNLYCRLIGETKRRHGSCAILIDKPPPISPDLVDEFLLLQLRKICEIIAVACVAAHGEIKEARASKLTGDWNAHRIMRKMERLNPQFYPVPFVIKGKLGDDSNAFEIAPMKDPYLTKDDLFKLYNVVCGNGLHLGSLEDVITGKKPQHDHESLREWAAKIGNLLRHHQIHFLDTNTALFVDADGPGTKVNATMWHSAPLPVDDNGRPNLPSREAFAELAKQALSGGGSKKG